ncbi:MAG: hypothetical protein K0U75_08195 [Actinomycetia bacterium]|nr:hypothetical protein [Actinomycetes bacterium]
MGSADTAAGGVTPAAGLTVSSAADAALARRIGCPAGWLSAGTYASSDYLLKPGGLAVQGRTGLSARRHVLDVLG